MASFATPADLAVFLGREELEDAEFLQAQLLLDLASDQIRRWARQTIDLVASDVAILAGSWSSELILPERPVVAVSAVSVDGTALTADTGYTMSPPGVLHVGPSGGSSGRQGATGLRGGTWGGPAARVTVTYTHGFAAIPTAVKAATLAMAARVVASPSGVRSETVAGYSVTYAAAGSSVQMDDTEMAALSWLRRSW